MSWKVILGPIWNSWYERAFLAQKDIFVPKAYLCPERAYLSRKGIYGPKGHLHPERAFVARKGIIDPKGYYIPTWHYRHERAFLAQKCTRGLKGNLSSIISIAVSERLPSMLLESFVCKFSLMACVIKDAWTDHPPTVSVFLFDIMKVALTNIFIIITLVQLTILFYHGRKCTRSCGSSTTR